MRLEGSSLDGSVLVLFVMGLLFQGAIGVWGSAMFFFPFRVRGLGTGIRLVCFPPDVLIGGTCHRSSGPLPGSHLMVCICQVTDAVL